MGQALRQAAVIPVSDGRIWMVTSSSGKRWVIPKGMIDPGHTAGEAALIEAWEEAGLVGRLVNEPVGTYLYEKYGRTYHVTVFLLQVTDSAIDWPERNSRRREWLQPDSAIERIEEPGLREIVEGIFRPSTVNVDQF
jgi:8-oxo-dGTP pyrophosphatase MutT (NUDIX family)